MRLPPALFRYGAASARKPEILLSFFIERLGNAGGPRLGRDEFRSVSLENRNVYHVKRNRRKGCIKDDDKAKICAAGRAAALCAAAVRRDRGIRRAFRGAGLARRIVFDGGICARPRRRLFSFQLGRRRAHQRLYRR